MIKIEDYIFRLLMNYFINYNYQKNIYTTFFFI